MPESTNKSTRSEHQPNVHHRRRVLIDIEADSLQPKIIWCIVAKDIDTGEVFKFKPTTPVSGHCDWQDSFKTFVKECKQFIGHNIISFDIYWINKLLGLNIKVKDCVDTLVLSRLFRPVAPFKEEAWKLKTYNRIGGHSLDAWGAYLKFPKFDFNDFSKFSEEMLSYCVQDVELTHRVYLELMKESKGFSQQSIDLEHQVAHMLAEQERNGFFLIKDNAKRLKEETDKLLLDMDAKLKDLFPPLPKLVRNYVIRYTKDGAISKVSERIMDEYSTNPRFQKRLQPDGSYDLYVLKEFNAQSPAQVAERLLQLGWQPKKFTEKGAPKTDKVTIAEAINDLVSHNSDLEELRCLSSYNIIADRNQKATKWLELVKEDGRVHGKVNPIGAGTHRCAHYDDNMANIARVVTGSYVSSDTTELQKLRLLNRFDSYDANKCILHVSDSGKVEYAFTGLEGAYGWDSRNCWGVPSADRVLVGADASGIQLRALAHYMGDEEYIKQLLEGDIHEVNRIAAGIDTRPKAKTFIYAFLLGAGDEKTGTIIGVNEDEFQELFDFAESTYQFNRFNPNIPKRANLFYYIVDGLRSNGRAPSKKLVACIIKGWRIKKQFLERTPALKRLKSDDIPAAVRKGYLVGLDGRKCWLPNQHLALSVYLQSFEAIIMKAAMYFYHAELKEKGIPFKQVAFVHDEFQIETYIDYGDVVGQAVVNAIKKAGTTFNSLCPLDGEYKVGRTWAQTH